MSVATRLHSADGAFTIERVQNCEPILDLNKALANDGDGFSASRAMRRVASVPLVLIEKWMNEEGIDFFNPDHAEAIKRKLNDPDYLWLRTAPGRV